MKLQGIGFSRPVPNVLNDKVRSSETAYVGDTARSIGLAALLVTALGFAAARGSAGEECLAYRSTLKAQAVNLYADSRLRPKEAMPRIAPGTKLCILGRATTGSSLHHLWAYEVRHGERSGWVPEYGLEPAPPPASVAP